MRVRILIVVLNVFWANISAASEVKSGDFSFTVPGDWEIVNVEAHSTRAMQTANGKVRAFQVSVYTSNSVTEGGQLLVKMIGYIGELDKENSDIQRSGIVTDHRSSRAPFKYAAYTYKVRSAFLVAVAMGSNGGNLLMTYEGTGDVEKGIAEVKSILETMKYKGT